MLAVRVHRSFDGGVETLLFFRLGNSLTGLFVVPLAFTCLCAPGLIGLLDMFAVTWSTKRFILLFFEHACLLRNAAAVSVITVASAASATTSTSSTSPTPIVVTLNPPTADAIGVTIFAKSVIGGLAAVVGAPCGAVTESCR